MEILIFWSDPLATNLFCWALEIVGEEVDVDGGDSGRVGEVQQALRGVDGHGQRAILIHILPAIK